VQTRRILMQKRRIQLQNRRIQLQKPVILYTVMHLAKFSLQTHILNRLKYGTVYVILIYLMVFIIIVLQHKSWGIFQKSSQQHPSSTHHQGLPSSQQSEEGHVRQMIRSHDITWSTTRFISSAFDPLNSYNTFITLSPACSCCKWTIKVQSETMRLAVIWHHS